MDRPDHDAPLERMLATPNNGPTQNRLLGSKTFIATNDAYLSQQQFPHQPNKLYFHTT